MLEEERRNSVGIRISSKYFSYLIIFFSILVVKNVSATTTSINLDSWEIRASNTSDNLYGVTYGNGKFVTVGGGYGTILTSENGINWAFQNSDATHVLLDVNFINDTFVSVGAGGTILFSSDSSQWTIRDSMTDYYWLHDVTYGNNKYVIGGLDTIMSSGNGVDWTAQYNNAEIYDIVYANNIFVAVGSGGAALTSPDGEEWTSQSLSLVTGDILFGVAYGNNIFVAAGHNGTIITSPNGEEWTLQDSGTNYHLNRVLFAGGKFLIAGTNGTILSSQDGITWTSHNTSTDSDLRAIAYGNESFIAVGWDGIIIQTTPIPEPFPWEIFYPAFINNREQNNGS